MKIAVVGLGAVGGFIAARLAQSGAGFEVSALARGTTLAAVQARGLTLREADRERQVPLAASDDARALGPQDLVVVAVKGPALDALAPTLA